MVAAVGSPPWRTIESAKVNWLLIHEWIAPVRAVAPTVRLGRVAAALRGNA
jgi:hypothetical protein